MLGHDCSRDVDLDIAKLVAICNHDTSNLSCARAACALVLLYVHAGSDIPYLGQLSHKSIYKTKELLQRK